MATGGNTILTMPGSSRSSEGRVHLPVRSSSSCSAGALSLNPGRSEEVSLGTWESVHNAPPCEINAKAVPIGRFWGHLRQYACDRAAKVFQWHLDWNKQCPALKTRFKLRMRELYPSSWDDDYLMKYIGNNIMDKRARIKDKQQEGLKKWKCTIPMGYSTEAWNAIWDSLSDPKKQSKAYKCRVAVEAQFKEGGGTHKWGRHGLKGTMARFESDFGRTSTAEELEYAKFHAYGALATRTRDALSRVTMQVAGTVQEAEYREPPRTSKKRKNGAVHQKQ